MHTSSPTVRFCCHSWLGPTRAALAVALLLIAAAPRAHAWQAPPPPDDEPVALLEPVASMRVLFDGRSTPSSRIEAKLENPVRAALNDWAPVADRLGLAMAVPEHASALVFGHADDDVLQDAAGWADATHDLLNPGLPPAPSPPPVIIIVLFDRKGHGSDAWPGLLAELVERKILEPAFESAVRADKGSLTLRQASLFLQPTYDVAGNSFAGDDEFRLSNEVAHKTAQFMVEARCGRQPEPVRWGVGYVAEQRLFGSSYHFDFAGFVASGDHFGWPGQVSDWLKERERDDEFELADTLLDTERPGSTSPEQQCAWITLDHLLHEQPETFATLLTELGDLDRKADPHQRRPTYAGSKSQARQTVTAHLEDLDLKDLATWGRRFKPNR